MIRKKSAISAMNGLWSTNAPSNPNKPSAVNNAFTPIMIAAATNAGMIGIKISEKTLNPC